MSDQEIRDSLKDACRRNDAALTLIHHVTAIPKSRLTQIRDGQGDPITEMERINLVSASGI